MEVMDVTPAWLQVWCKVRMSRWVSLDFVLSGVSLDGTVGESGSLTRLQTSRCPWADRVRMNFERE